MIGNSTIGTVTRTMMTGTVETGAATIGSSLTGCRGRSRRWTSPRLALWLILATSVWIGLVDRNQVVAADILFSSIDGDTAESIQLGTFQASYWRYAAQQFQTHFSNELTEVQLQLFRVGSTPGSFNVEVWSNGAGNVPGSLQQTLVSGYNFVSVPTSSQAITFEVTSALNKFTNYWLVIDAQNVTGGNLQWALTDNSTGTGVAGRSTLRNTDTSTAWETTFPGNYGRMEIVAVPEQGTLPLAGIGLLGAGWAARRMKRRPGDGS